MDQTIACQIIIKSSLDLDLLPKGGKNFKRHHNSPGKVTWTPNHLNISYQTLDAKSQVTNKWKMILTNDHKKYTRYPIYP